LDRYFLPTKYHYAGPVTNRHIAMEKEMTAATISSKKRRTRRSPNQWRELFSRFELGGQTRAQFCAEHGLGVSTFDRWRRRLHQDGSGTRVTSGDALFVELAQRKHRGQVSY
jgi:transposase-like protein